MKNSVLYWTIKWHIIGYMRTASYLKQLSKNNSHFTKILIVLSLEDLNSNAMVFKHRYRNSNLTVRVFWLWQGKQYLICTVFSYACINIHKHAYIHTYIYTYTNANFQCVTENMLSSTVVIKLFYGITYVCQNFDLCDIRGKIPKTYVSFHQFYLVIFLTM